MRAAGYMWAPSVCRHRCCCHPPRQALVCSFPVRIAFCHMIVSSCENGSLCRDKVWFFDVALQGQGAVTAPLGGALPHHLPCPPTAPQPNYPPKASRASRRSVNSPRRPNGGRQGRLRRPLPPAARLQRWQGWRRAGALPPPPPHQLLAHPPPRRPFLQQSPCCR
jgi:hypothetical protein